MISVTKVVNEIIPRIIKSNKNIIPFLVGKPGISKTSQLHSLCNKNNWALIPIHLGLIPMEMLSGIPEIRRDKENENISKTYWSIPEIIHKANELSKTHEYVILFFDDIHLADKSKQSYFFELASERSLQGYKLNDNVKIVCAGNDSAKAGAKAFMSAIINRFVLIPVYLPVEEWIKWAIENNIHNSVISFIIANKDNENFLCGEEDVKPFPSPRAYERLSDMLYLFEDIYGSIDKMFSDSNLETELIDIINGTIGSQVGSEFLNFIKYTQGVDFLKLAENPEKIMEYPEERRIPIYYSLVNKVITDKKLNKYIYRLLDFAFTILGDNGNQLHHTIVILDLLKSVDKELYDKVVSCSELYINDFVDTKYVNKKVIINKIREELMKLYK